MDYGLDYSKAEGLFSKSTGTAGSNPQKHEGSFEKLSVEGVPTNLSRSIVDGRRRLENGEGEEMLVLEREEEAVAPWSGTSELAGALGEGPTGHYWMN